MMIIKSRMMELVGGEKHFKLRLHCFVIHFMSFYFVYFFAFIVFLYLYFIYDSRNKFNSAAL